MAYEVTATRKRPRIFDELVDQEFVVSTLKSSIKQGRIAHAYLFSGPRGVGKTSAARILAKALNCEKGPTDTPCGICSNCEEISAGNSLDVIEIDGASNTSVNDVREIKDEVLFAPNSCRFKVYIIDEVHMLSNSAFNALLKTIEEPPPYIVFIFATTEIHKVPATIRSRCQQFNFKLISLEGIKKRLEQAAQELSIQAEDDALLWISKEATGSLRDAYTLFDQIISFSEGHITLSGIRDKLGIVGFDELNEVLLLMAKGETAKVLEYTDAILEKGISVEQFVIDLSEYFRNLLFLKHGIKKDSILGFSPKHFPLEILDAFTVGQLEMAIELLLDLFRTFRFSLNQKFELELVMSKLSVLKNMIGRREIIEEVRKIKEELTGETLIVENTKDDCREKGDDKRGTGEEKTGTNTVTGGTNTAIGGTNTAIGGTNTPYTPDNETNILQELIQFLHSSKKLTLASAMEKVHSWECRGDTLILLFDNQNKFSGEIIKKDKRIIAEKLSSLLRKPSKLTIQYADTETGDPHTKDERIEVLKHIFKGEIVKGE
ncbi:MAG: DNA polymerase III subunit gamma/tau [Spirochaetales bacterium]|nr:DNA polymerase III subunit gamma/tau [Spirochaetales bacterium]